MFAYVGSRTTRERNARGEGLSVYELDARSGDLRRIQLLGDLVNPSYLALSADGTRLYAVHGDLREVSSFIVDRASGHLTPLNQRSTEGLNPVHLAIAPDGRHLLVTNHLGATVVLLSIADDGSLGDLRQTVPFEGPIGPHRVEQKQAKPHFNLFDPTGRVVVVPDKGLDRTYSFVWTGHRLRPAVPPFAASREGAGPRNVVFHPQRPLAYVVNELDSTITTHGIDAESGALTPLHVVSTLPATFIGHSRAASIAIDAAGRTLYASNRGHDSIALFRIDGSTGWPEFIDTAPSGGRTPRFFTLSPDGRWLFVLNEDADNIAAMSIDAHDGRPKHGSRLFPCGSPVCMVFSR